MKRVGVTGTRHATERHSGIIGVALAQHIRRGDRLYHGACAGIDVIVGTAGVIRGYQVHAIIPANRALVPRNAHRWCTSFEDMPPGTSYLDRDDRLVSMIDMLLAFPRTATEEVRSGTWATVRRARKRGIPVVIVPLEATP